MKSTSESLSHPETSYGKAAGGNCVVVRRGGEQPEADLRSQTKVNPIRFTTAASLRMTGEACRMSGNRFLLHPSFTGEKRVVGDGWGENAGKVSCGRVEICPGRNPREQSRVEVRAVIVVSPLLANIYLDPFDWLMAGLGFEIVRYADDMVVLCHTEEEAKAALDKLREWMAGADSHCILTKPARWT